jgi:hypothetical protein
MLRIIPESVCYDRVHVKKRGITRFTAWQAMTGFMAEQAETTLTEAQGKTG